MSFLTSDLPTTLLLISIGIVIGAALTKILGKSAHSAELQQQLEESREQLKNYQQEVGEHFQKTAKLVNDLTESYRTVHEHLSEGAQTLANESANTLETTPFKALEKTPAQSVDSASDKTEMPTDSRSTS